MGLPPQSERTSFTPSASAMRIASVCVARSRRIRSFDKPSRLSVPPVPLAVASCRTQLLPQVDSFSFSSLSLHPLPFLYLTRCFLCVMLLY